MKILDRTVGGNGFAAHPNVPVNAIVILDPLPIRVSPPQANPFSSAERTRDFVRA